MHWYTKSRRAQTNEDYETWIQGGVMPTLNAFDNGDVRTTIIIFHPHYHDGARVQGDTMNTLTSRMGTGGNNVSCVATVVTTTADVVGSLQARDYKGVGNQYVAENKLIISYPIQDGRDMNKEQNGIGLGGEDDPSYTLDRTGAQAVAYAIQGTVIGRSDTSGPQGKGYGEENDPMFTIDTVSGHGVAISFDTQFGSNATTFEDMSPTLKASQQPPSVTGTSVRRLTPVECERLQGFPDDWTAGQSDSARYKQMGNAVAVPVVEWIIQGICDTI
jgi:hypothetical protein